MPVLFGLSVGGSAALGGSPAGEERPDPIEPAGELGDLLRLVIRRIDEYLSDERRLPLIVVGDSQPADLEFVELDPASLPARAVDSSDELLPAV